MPFSAETLDFLFINRAENRKEWYDEHKDDCKRLVTEPLCELVAALTPTMLDIDPEMLTEPRRCISRVRRDTRFSKDKTLYRDTAWVSFMRDRKLYHGLPGFFLELSPRGWRYGCGYYEADRASMECMRSMMASDDPAYLAAADAYEAQHVFGLEGERFKRDRCPGETGTKHDWLNLKNIDFICNSTDFDLLFSDKLAEKCSEDFRLLAPIYNFFMKAEALKSIAG